MSELIYPHKGFETDYVKSIGIRQFIPGDLFIQYHAKVGDTETVYTVPANKCLHLSSINLNIKIMGTRVIIRLLDDAGNERYRFFDRANTSTIPTGDNNIPFTIPLEIPEGWYIQIYIIGATTDVAVSLYGYIFDV